MSIKFIATCLTRAQLQICAEMGIEVAQNYAHSYGEITQGCTTDFSIHCFNSATLEALKKLGAHRATLHPELNLAQIRDIKKCIDTEAVIYGKLPLMRAKRAVDTEDTCRNRHIPSKPDAVSSPTKKRADPAELIDRTGAHFPIHGNKIYNSVPIFMADKLNEAEKSGITHGRLIFTTENADDTRAIIKAYMHRKALEIDFTRGKFYAKALL
ncbi:MAG: U32 family peptidase [Defluviitaleaceae bacterium]|nr:U32 family peptidase [Defluviitaleaceae bacterium]